ncbi:hypothetical protein [Brevundimonas sp. 'scallop']|uniref:hypothetical protein n=1 Tax=Brevundimonas sp. 'scallop' TaxID=2562582 RepID=UPI0013E1B7D6|nr:hypothetical protein [Brevundimonas sp. 'scallop']QIF81895.1 hypothetical protein E4341_09395 [Brevundimonas sp. 'scallop']
MPFNSFADRPILPIAWAATDALRLPDRFVQLATDAAWARNVDKAAAMLVDLDDLYALLLAAKAAPASPLPGGGYFVPAMTFDHIAAILWSKGLGEYATTMSRNSIALPAAPTGDVS